VALQQAHHWAWQCHVPCITAHMPHYQHTSDKPYPAQPPCSTPPPPHPLLLLQALKKVDMEGVMFFMGILMAVAALDSAGVLQDTAAFLGRHVRSPDLIAAAIGMASAVIDNVPLVAATMGMYDLATQPADSELWQLVAYCAGTGGSLLVIGSAAGVAYMGLEKATFGWYLRRVTPWAMVGYLTGIATYVVQHGGGGATTLLAATSSVQ
jgi:Na+/H+ antiporter NhaD/arsenite permease-like protein